MTCRDDITAALNAMGPVAPDERRWVLLGPSASRAIHAEGDIDDAIPFAHGEARLMETDAFDGWEAIDRPNVIFSDEERRKLIGKTRK